MTAHASFFESFLWQGVTYQSSYCTCISCKYIIQIRKGFVNLQKPGHWTSSISACFFTAPKNIWAKTDPFQSIETHSILAGITAQTIWDRMLPPGVQIQLEQLLSCEQIQVRAGCGSRIPWSISGEAQRADRGPSSALRTGHVPGGDALLHDS